MARSESPPAYSYQRFSSPEQSKGDSLRRQTELRDAWLARNGVRLDTSVTLRDAGVSGYTGKHRENADRHALATFLNLVEKGRVPRGSFLIVESLDRLTREDIRPALTLLLNLIEAGVRVVQLLPVEQLFDEQVDAMKLMMAIMELSRGHSESRMKSERVGAAWREKKKRAAAGGEVLTRAVPGWLRVEGGKFVVKEPAAAAVRRIFRMATEGHGLGAITKALNAEKVPPIGRARHWALSYVAKIVANRAAVGEYQPHAGPVGPTRKPDGPPIPNYFPAVVTEDEWYAARAAVAQRRGKPGRIGKRLNLFTGLLKDARDGGPIHVVNKGKRNAGPVLSSYRASQGIPGARSVSFPLGPFEAAVLSLLREIDPAEVLGAGEDGGAAERVGVLCGRVADREGRMTALQAAMESGGGEVRAVVDVLRRLEAEQEKDLAALAAARVEAASPASVALGECKSLADAAADAPDGSDVRVRLRAALRRVVAEAYCLFVPAGQRRWAAVQLHFAGGGRRDYLIHHRPTQVNGSVTREAAWWARSFALPAGGGGFDLRKRKGVAKLEKFLREVDPADVAPAGKG